MLAGLVVIVIVFAAAWVLLASSWATVKSIEVSGTERIDPAVIRAIAGPEAGHSLLLARVDEVRSQIARLPLVRAVSVTRSWPSAIRIDVIERQPVAAVPAAIQSDVIDAANPSSNQSAKQPPKQRSKKKPAKVTPITGYRLVDPDGVTVETVTGLPQVPAGMPVFTLDVEATRGVQALNACVVVSKSLPDELRSQVKEIGATSPDGIWLELRSGANVQWGDSTQNDLKADVLKALMKQHAKAYDLRAPENPAIVS